MRAEKIGRDTDTQIYLKLECDLPTGSFKPRGALYALSRNVERRRVCEVTASSTGNHGAAVAFAADKLVEHQETQPVARVLVVISDGQDNSSKKTLKEAIETAERDGVSVYTISTSDVRYVSTAMLESTILGDRALKALAEYTGGSSFAPGSVRNLARSLGELEEFIHSRYLVAYKPAVFTRESRFRTIDIEAAKARWTDYKKRKQGP